jgi:4-amino-4-deoxy-L-arabinose transferase-like glycosyltransferase
MKKSLIVAFILLAIATRFLWLDKVPNAIGGDELNYAVTAKAIVINGTDMTGKWNPLTVFAFNYPYGEGQAELEYFLLYPFTLAGFSLFSVKFIFALFSVLSVLLIYLITKKLFDERVAIVAGFISSINPWSVFIGRTGYEMVVALFLALLSFYILLIARNWKILIVIPFLFCLFYSYIAVKLIFIPFLLLLLIYIYFYRNNKQFLKQYLIVFASCLALVLFFVVSLKLNTSSSRAGELFTISNQEIARQVNEARKSTIQSPVTNLLENKYTVYSKFLAIKFLNIFSSDYLFNYSDQFVGIGKHGLFYYIDSLFLFLGVIFLASKNRKLLVFILALIVIGALPHVFHQARTDNFTPHIFLTFPFLIMLISFGIGESISLFKKRHLNSIAIVLVVLTYSFLFLNFSNLYFFYYPLKGNSDFQVRVLSRYVDFAGQSKGKVTVYTNRSHDLFKKYLFYSNSYNKKTFPGIQRAILGKEYFLNNVKFTDCPSGVDVSKEASVAVYDSECGKLLNSQKHIVIPLLIDGGERFGIYNDSVCEEFLLKRYPKGLRIDDFNIEKLSKKDFCQTFITSPW